MTGLTPQTVAIIATIGGVIIPPITSFLKRENWPTPVKQLIAAVLACGVAAVGIRVADPSAWGLGFTSLAALVFAASQGVYGALFRGSVTETGLRKIASGPPTPAPPAPPA